MSEIILYKLNDNIDDIKVRKSPKERVWMDETTHRFAYRCLPLAIANQHGWEITANERIRVIWRGRDDIHSIKILEGNRGLVQSHFGFGVLTFSIPFLMRTSKNVNLYVTGPINQPKRAIAALSGIVETDWNPATFTMNWLFTEPDHEVIFEKDEPICYFYPVMRGLVDNTDLLMRPIGNVPEEKAKYDEWSRVREQTLADKFHKDDDWEKYYFQGKYSDGSKCPINHQTKLKLKDPKEE